MEEREKEFLLKLSEKEIGPAPGKDFFPNIEKKTWEKIDFNNIPELEWLFLKQTLKAIYLKRMLVTN